jgi:hypothetical protein
LVIGTPLALPAARISSEKLEAPSGFEPEMEVLQTSALPLGDGADRNQEKEVGAGNGIRTRDFDLGKVALYH